MNLPEPARRVQRSGDAPVKPWRWKRETQAGTGVTRVCISCHVMGCFVWWERGERGVSETKLGLGLGFGLGPSIPKPRPAALFVLA